MITNYFRCGLEPFFFDERSQISISNAFSAVIAYQSSLGDVEPGEFRLTVYQMPKHPGPWQDLCRVVGEWKKRGA